ncbi:MAG TPA: ABC transporter ATP-binding protein, partial [Acidimicrobiales bacterium]|nr:ABC transporter ATP-binding protein [Acidimicrobiales bacterium]
SPHRQGLPFAGVPQEMQARVDKLLEQEPDHQDERVAYEPVQADRRPFSLRRLLVPHRAALTGSVALVVLETAALQAGPLLTKVAIDDGIRAGSRTTIVVVALVYLSTVVIGAVTTRARIAWTGRVGERLLYDLRCRVFAHFQRLSVAFFSREKAGRLMTRMTSDLDNLTQLLQEGLVQLFVQGLTMAFVTGVLIWLNPPLAAVTLLVVVPVMVAATLWYRAASDPRFDDVRDRIADVMAHLQESLSGVRIVTAHNRQRRNVAEHRSTALRYRKANDGTAIVGGAYGGITEVVGLGGQVVILVVGGRWVLDGSLEIGELVAFVLYLTAFFAPIQQLVQLYNTYQQGQASIRKLRDLFAEAPTVAQRPGALDLPVLAGEVRLEGVTFEYDPGRPVLHHVDLTIPAGETFAFVGETGAGKSTIAKLVNRLYDPTEGRVLLDGVDIRDVTLASVRRQVGTVPQEAFLFGGSIRENVAFARPDATDDEVVEACRLVGLGELLERLPDGIDTPVHERGVSLSSGERQLLALARAFLARPRILVLDEATSNLDLRSEARIEEALDALLEGRTSILIAHRLATARRADRIAVVHDGRIVELGTHADLLAAGGRYATMVDTWQAHA